MRFSNFSFSACASALSFESFCGSLRSTSTSSPDIIFFVLSLLLFIASGVSESKLRGIKLSSSSSSCMDFTKTTAGMGSVAGYVEFAASAVFASAVASCCLCSLTTSCLGSISRVTSLATSRDGLVLGEEVLELSRVFSCTRGRMLFFSWGIFL